MRALERGLGRKVKRFVVDFILAPAVPHRRLEAALLFWARLVYRTRKPLIIGVTGSVGKSTTTAMIGAALSHREAQRVVGPVAWTAENMNDDVAFRRRCFVTRRFLPCLGRMRARFALLCRLPFRALRVVAGRYPSVMVLEFGVGSTADLHRLVTIAPPKISVVTRIGAAHLEKLKSLEGVVHEKSALVRAVPASGSVILGQEHDYVAQLERAARAADRKFKPFSVQLESRRVALRPVRRLGAVLAAVKIAPFGDGLSRVRELDAPRVPGRGYPGLQTPSPGTAGTSARGVGCRATNPAAWSEEDVPPRRRRVRQLSNLCRTMSRQHHPAKDLGRTVICVTVAIGAPARPP